MDSHIESRMFQLTSHRLWFAPLCLFHTGDPGWISGKYSGNLHKDTVEIDWMSSVDFNFSKTVDGAIWTTWVVPDRPWMLLEVRHEARRMVRFYLLDYQTGEWLWQEESVPEPWWVSVAGVTSTTLVLHKFKGYDSPEHTSLLAVDLEAPAVLWQRETTSLISAAGDVLRCANVLDPAVQVVLHARTGKKIDLEEPNNVDEYKISPLVKPFQYMEGTPYFGTVSEFARTRLQMEPVAAVEYLEHRGLILFTLHVKRTELVSYLFVLTEQGEVLLNEKTNTNLKGIAVDTFFLLEGWLFFVKNGNELLSYKLV